MKRFSFPLDRVLDWKGVVAQQEQLALDSLHQQREEITASLLALSNSIDDLSRDTQVAESGHELACSAHARSALVRHRSRTEAQHSACETRIVSQQHKLREAETERRLLDKLKERSRLEWSAEASRDMESTASDLYLGGWKRR
jgi:hypothetical protein